MTQLVYLAHGFIEDGGDYSSMGVAWRSGVTLAQAEAADETVLLFVIREVQVHALRIVFATAEAIVLLQAEVWGIVALAG